MLRYLMIIGAWSILNTGCITIKMDTKKVEHNKVKSTNETVQEIGEEQDITKKKEYRKEDKR